jgi:hypothetical protein
VAASPTVSSTPFSYTSEFWHTQSYWLPNQDIELFHYSKESPPSSFVAASSPSQLWQPQTCADPIVPYSYAFSRLYQKQFFWAVLGFEFMVLYLLGSCSTTWVVHPTFFF